MAKVVSPKVFIIAATAMDNWGLQGFLDHLGVPDWTTDASSEAEKLVEVAGKSCYLSFSTDLNKNLTRVGGRSNYDYIQKGIVGTRHGSVLEHAYVTFAICGVSRVFTHELVRHRAGCAYSQVSGRYVRTDEIDYFLPSVIDREPLARQLFFEAFCQMEEWTKRLEGIFRMSEPPVSTDFHLKKTLTSAFRRLIGNGQANHIVFTANHRALRNIIELRTDPSAEQEIREVFLEVFMMLKVRFPALYGDAEVKDGRVLFAASKV